MSRRQWLAGAAASVPAAYAGGATGAQGEAEEGFQSLFDGKTLRGWHIREGPESAFYIKDGTIVVHEGSNFPTWLCSDREYENFDFRCEFFLQGWMDSGVYLHAPEHGRNAWIGFYIKLFHKQDPTPLKESAGAIFPLVAPRKVNVRNRGEWNGLRILMDWPLLRVWINEELVQDVDVESIPELRYRLRRGYLGLESLSYPIRFRN
ncbi:MAG: 3-keto-disaccharide hydrolase, partial [Bryobacteraceae bacterium]